MPSRRAFLGACAGALAALTGCVSLDPPTADGSWPRRTLDNDHTGHAPTDGPTTNLHTEWQWEAPGGWSQPTSPVVDDGTLYYAHSYEARRDDPGGAWAMAFDAATGESLWTTELFRTDEFHYFYHADSLVLDDDRLFVQTKPGLKMLDTDGTVQWTFENLYAGQQMPDVVPPVVTDDVVVTGTYESSVEDTQHETVYGIDPDTGEERWRTAFPDLDGMWQLAAADGVVYVPMLDGPGHLVALDAASGEEQWRRRMPINGVPTIVDDTLLALLREGDAWSLAALDLPTRTVRWRTRIGPRWGDAGLAVDDDLVYHAASLGAEARSLTTGERVWRFGGQRTADGKIPDGAPEVDGATTPVVADGAVYVPGWIQRDTTYGHLFVLDAATGTELGRVEMGRNRRTRTSVPAITSDLAFVGAAIGDLYAFGECGTELAGHCLVD